eukprot:1654489-Amphidinium_carterae.4
MASFEIRVLVGMVNPLQSAALVQRSAFHCAIVLWSEDTELAKTKQGVRLFRSLAGKAAQLAECLSD